jgi:thiosulfate/3-mercaptopyruvate sulfurtransferase
MKPATPRGHWPGAFFLDAKCWEALARTPEHALDNGGAWSKEFGHLGIDGSRQVLVYDDRRMTEAARVWFILQLHGADAEVIDGGWKALLENLPAQGQDAEPHVATEREFLSTGRQPVVTLVQRAELRDGLLGQVQVLDARTAAEFSGADLRSNARGGHLPGAKSLPHAGLLNEDGTLQGRDALQERLSSAGIDKDRPVVTHCDAGGRAALAALAAVVAGQRDVWAYYLSYSDWAADGACPVNLA